MKSFLVLSNDEDLRSRARATEFVGIVAMCGEALLVSLCSVTTDGTIEWEGPFGFIRTCLDFFNMLEACEKTLFFIYHQRLEGSNFGRFVVENIPYYGDILRGLYPLFGESEPDDAVRDNAAGAVARMIMVHPESIPLNQVLPVFLKVLPLKEDREESMTVYSCVSTLVLSSNAQILFLVPDLVNVFAQVVASPVETSEVKAQIGRAFAHLISLYGQQMQPLLSNLSPAYANALAAFVPKS
ncbi:hypothetical protein ACFXTH_044532 [Malus domestica]